ncbi:CMGC/CDK/CDC2 protein Kinase [Phytophthora cinnamomi]|uniref:CMGC/CDK/CDC2 protein Kinase n=1 Tax=Phytophthora cinnamomi TaxID=4785 RepID=UPI0035593CD7|nr:CMGC/CDK/CDC2 protein Kinase [Phytophthora cinnamomi]
MKKARASPKGEGLPYFALRELAMLREMKHEHISSLELVSFDKHGLHTFFPFVDNTLQKVVNPDEDPEGGRALSETVTRKLLHQLLDAVAYCHRRGVLHRNLKPKHLLVKTPDPKNLSDAVLEIADFSLFLAYLREAELESWKDIGYLSRQNTLLPVHREMLVDWLIEVVDVFKMCPRTAFLAVNYTDRYLDIVARVHVCGGVGDGRKTVEHPQLYALDAHSAGFPEYL